MSTEAPFRPKARRARGLIDRRGPALAAERALVARIAAVYEAWGFEPLDTPAFEYADALGKFLPDQDRPNAGVFALEDDDGQWLALRYDLTAPLARFVAENYDALPKPYRRWAAGPVWRNEKPGPGRFREFWQCDADTVGAPGPAADAEMIAMLAAGLEAVGLRRGDYVVKANTRKLLNAAMDAAGIAADDSATRLTALRAADKLDRLGVEGVRMLLGPGRKDESGDFTKGAGLTPAQIAQIEAFLTAGRPTRRDTLEALTQALPPSAERDAGLAELEAIDETLRALGIVDDQAAFDPAIVRGLEYYTGPVFEAEFLRETKDEQGRPVRFGSVGSGGRYDDLVSRFKGQLIPATGCSIGVSRLAAALAAAGAGQAEERGPVVVLALDAERAAESVAMAAELRAAGLRAEAYLGGAGMKAQLKYADKRAAPVAVIVGSEERAAGQVALKNLVLGAKLAASAGEDRDAYAKLRERVQVTIPRVDLVPAVRRMLDEG